MVIVLEKDVVKEHVNKIITLLSSTKVNFIKVNDGEKAKIVVLDECGKLDPNHIESLEGVKNITNIDTPYKQASKLVKDKTIININGNLIGGDEFCVIAGPCSVEQEDVFIPIAKELAKSGVHFLRGGAYKPRTSPYSFQGLGKEGLKILAKAKKETGLGIITEAISVDTLDSVAKVADIIQIGARNMQNYELLKAAGQTNKPVLLKRGPSATIDEWILAAEYVLRQGNPNVILCERGIRTFEKSTRYTLDLSAVPLLNHLTHLPIIVDPSHGTGKRELVPPMSKAAAMCGANGVMLETHINPSESISDARQTISTSDFKKLMNDLREIATLTNKYIKENNSMII